MKKLKALDYLYNQYHDGWNVLNEIAELEDIISRTCESCHHYEIDTNYSPVYHTCKALSIKYLEHKTFSCSKYKRKK